MTEQKNEEDRKQILLPDGSYMPRLGQGTWQMAEDDTQREREILGLQYGIQKGITMIDSAEMYAGGKAEGRMEQGFLYRAFHRESLSARRASGGEFDVSSFS